MDEHLRTIEVALGVKIAHRHEQFKVDGPKLKAKRGMEMLQALYEIAAKPISDFISRHPSFKILALCFLLIIGISLIGEGLDFHIPKGYIYFSMAFSFFVDFIQLRTVKPKKVKS